MERAKLKLILLNCLREKQTKPILVVGEVGVGKTHLIKEVARELNHDPIELNAAILGKAELKRLKTLFAMPRNLYLIENVDETDKIFDNKLFSKMRAKIILTARNESKVNSGIRDNSIVKILDQPNETEKAEFIRNYEKTNGKFNSKIRYVIFKQSKNYTDLICNCQFASSGILSSGKVECKLEKEEKILGLFKGTNEDATGIRLFEFMKYFEANKRLSKEEIEQVIQGYSLSKTVEEIVGGAEISRCYMRTFYGSIQGIEELKKPFFRYRKLIT